MTEDNEYNILRAIPFPSNGWDVSYPDGRVPIHIERDLNILCTSWIWLRNEILLVLQDGTEYVWKRGYTMFVADGTRLLKDSTNEEFWGFEMVDTGSVV